jgi:hypothetical protein
LIPSSFELDAFRGFGFVSVCVLEVVDMGIDAGPDFLRFSNRELLYRVGIRFRNRPTFLTLRSDTGSPMLAALGGPFSHYGLRPADIEFSRARGRIRVECRSQDERANATLELGTTALPETPDTTVFDGVNQAAEHLIGMSFSVGATENGRVLVQDIEHDPWTPEFVDASGVRFDYLDTLAKRLDTVLEYDSTLAVADVHQTWRAARWVP